MTEAERVARLERGHESLEQKVQTLQIEMAQMKENRGYIENRFDRLEKQIAETRGLISRLAWLVIGGIIAALIKFVLDGGLNVTIS